jgi:hypothetical protein
MVGATGFEPATSCSRSRNRRHHWVPMLQRTPSLRTDRDSCGVVGALASIPCLTQRSLRIPRLAGGPVARDPGLSTGEEVLFQTRYKWQVRDNAALAAALPLSAARLAVLGLLVEAARAPSVWRLFARFGASSRYEIGRPRPVTCGSACETGLQCKRKGSSRCRRATRRVRSP